MTVEELRERLRRHGIDWHIPTEHLERVLYRGRSLGRPDGDIEQVAAIAFRRAHEGTDEDERAFMYACERVREGDMKPLAPVDPILKEPPAPLPEGWKPKRLR